MKKLPLVFLTMIILGALVFSIPPNKVSAYKAGYSNTVYTATTTPTIDGKWTTTDEWSDASQTIVTPSNVIFRDKWTSTSDYAQIWENTLIEVISDTTENAGDYIQLIYDATANGGSAPQTDDIRIDYTGHGTLAVYAGDGAAWVTKSFTAANVIVVSTFTSTPLSSTPHWVYEIQVEKMAWSLAADTWIFVATYDDGNSAAGVQAWPSGTSRNVPSDYGLNTSAFTPIPNPTGNDVPEG